MNQILTIMMLTFFVSIQAFAQRADDFRLKDALSGDDFSLGDHADARAVVLIFTNLNCPFSKLYEERIVGLHQQFSGRGFVFALINPHMLVEEEETAENMKVRASERNMRMPFLMDESQSVTKQFGITKLPEVVVVTSSPTGYAIGYRGAIDNNPQVAANASLKYLENALTAISNRRNPSPVSTRPVGCNVRFLSR
jgi:peroxiredoxin